MFVGNKYVKTNQIFSDDKVASDPYWPLIYITNETAIKKQKGFFGRMGNWESQICSPISVLPSKLWGSDASSTQHHPLRANEEEKLLLSLEATEAIRFTYFDPF